MKTLLRTSLALIAVAVIGIGAAGCSAVRPAALTVNGHDVSQSSVNRELGAIADNPGLRSELSATDGTIRSSGTAIWLTQVVASEVVDRELARREVKPNRQDQQLGAAQAEDFFGDANVFARFPVWFRDRAVERFARQQALLRTVGAPTSDDAVRAVYLTTIARLRSECPSGRFVSHILVPTREQAAALAAQIASGASFEQVARQQSTDRVSAADGGELGCIDGQQFTPPFEQAARGTPLNQVAGPFQTEFGWHLIIVRDTIPFEVLEGPLRRQLAQQSPESQRRVGELVAKADVDVDPRYGRWVVRDGRGTVRRPRGASTPATTPTPPTAPTPSPPTSRP